MGLLDILGGKKKALPSMGLDNDTLYRLFGVALTLSQFQETLSEPAKKKICNDRAYGVYLYMGKIANKAGLLRFGNAEEIAGTLLAIHEIHEDGFFGVVPFDRSRTEYGVLYDMYAEDFRALLQASSTENQSKYYRLGVINSLEKLQGTSTIVSLPKNSTAQPFFLNGLKAATSAVEMMALFTEFADAVFKPVEAK